MLRAGQKAEPTVPVKMKKSRKPIQARVPL
jgi:hypothetical protein